MHITFHLENSPMQWVPSYPVKDWGLRATDPGPAPGRWSLEMDPCGPSLQPTPLSTNYLNTSQDKQQITG